MFDDLLRALLGVPGLVVTVARNVGVSARRADIASS
jgi:hypothetical protein